MNIKEIKKIGIKNLVLLLIAGVLLLICTVSGKKDGKNEVGNECAGMLTQEPFPTVTNIPMPSDEERLEAILASIDGVGKTEVMIFYRCSEEMIPLTDEKGNPVQTMRTDSGAYIAKTKAPEIEGVLVVAEGAKKSEIIEYISDAAEALFGLPKHKIVVLPMKRTNGSD